MGSWSLGVREKTLEEGKKKQDPQSRGVQVLNKQENPIRFRYTEACLVA